MIKLTCELDGERKIALDFFGGRVIKNGSVIEIHDHDITQPEIQYLLAKKILIPEIKGEVAGEIPSYLPERKIFKCLLDKTRLLTLDSIKGSVWGGKLIDIKGMKSLGNQLTKLKVLQTNSIFKGKA